MGIWFPRQNILLLTNKVLVFLLSSSGDWSLLFKRGKRELYVSNHYLIVNLSLILYFEKQARNKYKLLKLIYLDTAVSRKISWTRLQVEWDERCITLKGKKCFHWRYRRWSRVTIPIGIFTNRWWAWDNGIQWFSGIEIYRNSILSVEHQEGQSFTIRNIK
jgi:hypothetical protein